MRSLVSGVPFFRKRGTPIFFKAAVVGWIVLTIATTSASLAKQKARPLRLNFESDKAIRVVVPITEDLALQQAADDLIRHLQEMGSAPILKIADAGAGGEIHLGPTNACQKLVAELPQENPEGWLYRVDGKLCILGADARGLFRGTYHALRDLFGVEWWTPEVTRIPDHGQLKLKGEERSGTPAFKYRDVFPGTEGVPFAVRSGWNGSFTRATEAWGGAIRYGGPNHVHNLYQWAPPEKYFESNPEWYSERAGFRTSDRAQLCMTQRALAKHIEQELRNYRRQHLKLHRSVQPSVYAISINDWGRSCRCDECNKATEQHQSRAAPMLILANRIAGSIEDLDPHFKIEVLAYLHTLIPPKGLEIHPRVLVRVAPLQQRNMLWSMSSEPKFKTILEDWANLAENRWLWVYPSMYGPHREFPFPSLRQVARDLKLAHQLEYDGIFSEHSFPYDGDRRELKQWVLSQLLMDPYQDITELEKKFAWGYYGEAGGAVLKYNRYLRKIARQSDPITFDAGPEAYSYLTPRTMDRLDQILRRGFQKIWNDEELVWRLARVRMNLDRARLLLDDQSSQKDKKRLFRRFVNTRKAFIQRNIDHGGQAHALKQLREEIDFILQEHADLPFMHIQD